jgi:hypothetical protein
MLHVQGQQLQGTGSEENRWFDSLASFITLTPTEGIQLSMGSTFSPTLRTVPLNSRPGTNAPLGVAL